MGGIDDGFRTPPKELTYQEIKDWLNWCIDQTRGNKIRNFKYKADLEILEKLVKIRVLKV